MHHVGRAAFANTPSNHGIDSEVVNAAYYSERTINAHDAHKIPVSCTKRHGFPWEWERELF